MPDQWIILVEGKEYGPEDLEGLREWRREGRVLPSNAVRRQGESAWQNAADIPGLFSEEPQLAPAHRDELIRPRRFGEAISETFNLYRRGFWKFFCLALLLEVPTLLLKLCFAFIPLPTSPEAAQVQAAPLWPSLGVIVFVFVMFAGWALYIAAIQIGTVDLARGKKLRLGDVLRRASQVWSRVLSGCLLVFFAFFVWSALPVLVILSLLSAPTISTLSLAFLLLGFQVYMTARLIVNFFFWQQCCVLENRGAFDSVRESKLLARNNARPSWIDRPLWRGAIFVSVWLLLWLGCSVAAELPFMLVRFSDITTFEEGFARIRELAKMRVPDGLMIVSYAASTIVSAAVRPLLGIGFVVLYFDARADLAPTEAEERES